MRSILPDATTVFGGRHGNDKCHLYGGRCIIGIEVALLGTALSAATAGTATAGLIGSAGTLFGISGLTSGAILSGLGTLGTIGSGISSIMGGMEASNEAKQQSEYALASAAMAGKESARQASEAAVREKQDYTDVMRRQKLAYLKSGVELEGSPLLVMESTRRTGESNIDQILSSGASQYATAMTEGQLASKKAKATGRSELIGGITKGVGQLATLAA